ncbi:MAG: DUF2865 domain-containing protein [Hyphomicrobium sp.]|nr:DUF2865 domain-containing protein [Hyphomicrobium sp.]
MSFRRLSRALQQAIKAAFDGNGTGRLEDRPADMPRSRDAAAPSLRGRQGAGRSLIGHLARPLTALAFGLAAGFAVLPQIVVADAQAQGFQWPWDEPAPRPQPRQPVEQPPPTWRPPADQAAPPGYAPQPYGAVNQPPICLQLEQRLVAETQRGNPSRDILPMIESQMRQTSRQLAEAKGNLERANCYDYFLFSKTLRNTRKCVDLSNAVTTLKRQLADLEGQRNQVSVEADRSIQDDIIRELARNNCGPNYAREAARRNEATNPFSSLWQEDSGGAGGMGGSYQSLPYATYRTVCVRLCDGYYFPVSFSTLPNHFQRDADVCASKCAAPAELFYYQNPGASVEQMVGATSNMPYSELKTAFRYRKEYVKGCSCKVAEYQPEGEAPPQQQGAAPGAAPGVSTGVVGARVEAPEATSGWTSETTGSTTP